MDIKVIDAALPGVKIISTDFVKDERGFFIESYHKERYFKNGLPYEFVQDNHSRSGRKVLRGIHYQDMTAPMGKLVRCTLGVIWDVAVDLQVGSPHFGKWVGCELSAENMIQLFVPPGYGHAFLTLSEAAEVQYRCTGYYTPSAEGVIAWDDPRLGIAWPCSDPVLSKRDRAGKSIEEYLTDPAFLF